jgi:hypothetical protein
VKKIGGVNFQGVRIGFGGMNHQFFGAYYHGFSGSSCYELGYGMATAGYGAVDGMKRVDSKEVFSILENVLVTVTMRVPEADSATNAPSIHAFGIAPRGSTSKSYRVSWNVKGAEPDQIWLSARCFGDLTIFNGTETGTRNSAFPCDVLYPAKSAKGSFDLEFRNAAGQEIKETIRLFAAGKRPVSKTVTISVSPTRNMSKPTYHR